MVDFMMKNIIYDKKIRQRSVSIFIIIVLLFFLVQIPSINSRCLCPSTQTENGIILVTGFGPWYTNDINPSGLTAIALNGTYIEQYQIIGIELPVDFHSSVEQMISAIETFQPVLIISLGLAASAENIRVETLAINIQFDSLADHPFKTLQWVSPNGPLFLRSTIDINASIQAIAECTPVVKSYSAGLYICNTVFYQTLYYVEEHHQNIPMGFIHVPQVTPTNPNGPELETIQQAIKACIHANIPQ